MPATPVASDGAYVAASDHTTLSLGVIRAGDIIHVSRGGFAGTVPVLDVTDSLGNTYTRGGFQHGPGSFQRVDVYWAISLIDGGLTVNLDSDIPFNQVNVVRVYRFPEPKVYAIDQASVGIGAFAAGIGFNNAFGTGGFSYADSLVVTSMMTASDVSDLTSLTGDNLQNTEEIPVGGPFEPARVLNVLDRSNTWTESVQGGTVQLKYNSSQGTGGLSSIVVTTFAVPLPDPAGLRDLGGRQYAVRGGAGEGSTSGGTDAQADWNRPIVIPFPHEVKVGDFLIVNVFVPSNPATIQPIPTDPYVTFDDYGPGFPELPPPNVNDYIQRILCPPVGSGSGSLSGTIAVYTCMVRYIPVQQHPDWQAGGIFQVKLHVSGVGSDAVYQATAIGITAVTVAGPPTNIAVAGLKSVVQVGTDGLISSDVIPSVPAGTYLHAFEIVLPTGAMSSMNWVAMEDYSIRAAWDFFQFPGQSTNFPRICAAAIMDKFAPSGDDYDAQVTAELPAFAGSMGIVLLAVSLPSRLTLVKEVIDGTASATDWTLSADGPTPISGPGGVVAPVDQGSYDLDETTGPAGYTRSDWVCVGTGSTQTGPSSVIVAVNGDVVCTIINTFTAGPQPPSPTSGGKSMRYQIPQKRWFPHSYEGQAIVYHYLDEPRTNQPNDMQLLLLAGDAVQKAGGNDDNGTPILSVAQPPSNDGGDQRLQKLYVDSIVDADSVSGAEVLAVTLLYNNAVTTGPTYTLTPASSRAQFIQNIASLVALGLYRNIAPRFAWTGGPDGPRIYAYEPAGFAQPYLSKFFVTQFITLSFSGWKHARRCYPALISNADVIFTIKTQDGRSFVTTIPSTSGQLRVFPSMIPQDCKERSFLFQLDGQGSDFALFPGDFTVEFKGWDMAEYIKLAVFQT